METGKLSTDYHLYKIQKEKAEGQRDRLQMLLYAAILTFRRAGYRAVYQSKNPVEALLFDAERELKNQKEQGE